MNLELNDVQTEVLIRVLSRIIQNDRYPLSPRIVAPKEILGQLRPEPERKPLAPRRHYEPPRFIRGRRRWPVEPRWGTQYVAPKLPAVADEIRKGDRERLRKAFPVMASQSGTKAMAAVQDVR
jgi:hypothetical protein